MNYDEILKTIQAQDFDVIVEGVNDIAKDAGHPFELNTAEDIAKYCLEDEAALEFVLA